jgi:3D (Asp-Asp-Asp) domain-containing protein
MIRKIVKLCRTLQSRVFSVSLLAAVLAFTVYQATEMTFTVIIREGNDVETYYTTNTNSDPREILEQYGYVTMAYDAVDFTGFQGKLGEIDITRAFPVTVRCDGTETELMVTGGSVADVLDEAGVVLANQDIVDLSMQWCVTENDVITVTRQEMVTREEKIFLPFESESVTSPLVAPGGVEIAVEGEEGVRVDTYAQMVIDGVEMEEYLLDQTTVKEPVTERLVEGFPSRAVSQLDFEVAFDENGEPESYTRVLRGQRAAGYSAPAGAGTASGRIAKVGHVAVNPGVIPYGSKLYIQSPGGGFVYGYAVAADTGGALMDGTVAVDLFYNTYEESAANGIKTVDIYILE